jgi:hypothetical protein
MNGWALLFATPLFAYHPPFVGFFGFYTLDLLVPFAALLGRRYGASGAVSIALGGLVAVVYIGGLPWGAVGGSPALYLVALAVAVIAATPRPLLECLRWPKEHRAAGWLTLIAPFLLLLFIYVGSGRSDRDSVLSLDFGFSLLGYFLLFVLGARGVRMTALLLGLAGAAVLSWALALNGLSTRPDSHFYVSVDLLQPSTVLAALAMIFGGAATREFLSGRPLGRFWRRPYLAVTLLVFLWFGPPPIASIPLGIPGVRAIELVQVTAALPLAAFVAGLLRGPRGTIFVTALVTGLTLLWIIPAGAFGSSIGPFYIGGVALEAPFVAAAYGVMGARAAEVRSGPADFRMLRFPTLLFLLFLVVLGATLEIVGEGGPLRVALAVLFVVAVIAVFIGALRVWRAMVARGYDVNLEKWPPFVAILGVIGAIVTNSQALWGFAKQLLVLGLVPLALFSSSARAELRSYFGAHIDGEVLAFLSIGAAAYAIGLIAIIRGLVRTAPKVYGDARKIWGFVREWRRGLAG